MTRWLASANLLLLALIPAGLCGADLLTRVPSAERARVNPYEHQESAERAGAKLYRRECAGCHGAERQGHPPAPPRIHMRGAASQAGAVFWALRNGNLRRGMPSFAHLPPPQRWQIITFLTAPE